MQFLSLKKLQDWHDRDDPGLLRCAGQGGSLQHFAADVDS